MRNAISTLLVLTGLVLVDSGRAATVTSTADGGPGSLRVAIVNAAPNETIDFSISGTITLTSGEILINKNLTIAGPGASNLVIQRSTDNGTPNFRIFNILSGTVTLSGLTVSNGREESGAGIYSSADLTLKDCVVTGNVATESGGGVFNTSMMLMSNCVIRANSAAGQTWDGYGGGIYNADTLTALNSTISSNSVTSGAGGGYGGGVGNDGTMTVVRSVIKDNSATGWPDGGGGFGGGVFNGFGTAYLKESTVNGNVARGGGTGLGEGGGVGNYLGTVELSRCTVSGNSAVGGNGGGWGEGGGLANDYGTLYVESSTVSGNISSGAVGTVGGGIFNDSGTAYLFYSTITANAVPGGFPEDGGGICNLWGSVEFESAIIAANLATVDFFNGEFGFIVSYGYNLVGSTSGFELSGSSGFFVPGSAEQFNVTAVALKLGPLQDNGGPTFTHALLCGSLAIDAGPNANAPLTDQRGFARIVSGTIDIGAYEAHNAAPSISCPAPLTLPCAPPTGMSATLSVAVTDFGAEPFVVVWTVDGTAAQTNAVAAGGPPTASIDFTALFGLGSHEVAVSVSGPSGCVASCSTAVEVAAFVPPTVSCPTVPNAAADATCQAAVPNVLGGVTVSAVCSDPNGIALSQSPVAGTLVGLGTHLLTVMATDAAGNQATCTATFTVTDNTPPTITLCAPNQSAFADATCHALVPPFTVLASDCNGPVVITQTPDAGTSVGLGVTTITLHVKDAANNESTCIATFTVTDNTPPTITSCAPNQSAVADATCHGLVPDFSAGVVAGDCMGPVVVTQTPAAGTSVGLGVTTVTLHVKDAANNESTCTATFTVTDNTAPTITSCAPNQSAVADATCHALVPDLTAGVVASDCNGPVVVTQMPVAGTSVGLGATTITLHVKDAANNESTCTATFTVTDNTPPTITSCAPNQSAFADATCHALVPEFTVVASDCNGPVVVTQTPAAGTSVGLGVTTITLHVKDAANNESTCTATFSVTDNTAPTITSCAPNQSAFADATCHGLVPDFSAGVVASDCNGPVVVTQTPLAGSSVGLGVTTITLHVKDAANNESTCTATFTVTDNTAPIITSCAPNQSAVADATCHGLVPDFSAGVVASDCNGPVVVTQTPAAGTSVGLGVTTITLHVKDAANNESTCTATFTVTDNTPPTITSCAPNQSAFADATCHALVPVFNVVASDCNGPVVVTQTPAAGTSAELGVTTITLYVRDAANNESTCTATFTVTDNTAPIITSCAPNQSAVADATCHALLPDFSAGVVASDCNGPVVVTQTPAAGTSVGLGVTTITLHVKDAANNESTCTATFTLTDNTAPTITTCAPNQSAFVDATCHALVPVFNVVASDCNGPVVVTQTPAAGTSVGLGVTTITLHVKDAANNESTCTATFTVTDNTAPTITTCAPNQSVFADATCHALLPVFNVVASDCNGPVVVTQTPAAGTSVGLGVTTITLHVKDAANNESTCTATLTVTDNTPPAITSCAPNQSTSAGANCQAAVPDFTVGVLATDCNGPLVITQSPVAGTLVGLGTTTVTLTVRDASGNSATCSATFTVTGNASLTLTCPSPTSTNANANCQAVVPNILSGVTASGSCAGGNIPIGNLTLSQSPTAGTVVSAGTHTITVTATDGAGNSATCTTTFTVIGANAAISILTLTENSNNDLPTGPHIITDSIVTWTYLITNPGCEALTNITVTDSVAGVIPAYQGGDSNLNGRLEPGETWTYAAYGIAGLGQYTNLGTVTATGTVTSAPVTGSNPDHYFGDPTPCPAGLFTYDFDPVTGDLNIKFYQFPAPNDNSYGDNAVGWEKGHTFTQLVQSDKAGFQLRNPSGVVKLDFWIDCLSEKAGTPSGYGSLGPWGGDGSVIVGTLTPNDITFDTSIARNLNNLGYFVGGVQTAATMNGTNGADLLLNSPPTLDKYRNYTLKTPNPWTNGWDFKNSYYVTIKKAKLNSLGFNKDTWRVEPDLAGLHNSPAKPCPVGVVGAQFIPAAGGDQISADGAVTNAFTTLTGPSYSEDVAGQVGLGTIVIKASAGFAFDTGGTPPTVLVAKLSGSGNQTVQGSITSVTATQITYTVTSKGANQSQLTWQNIRVRPTSGTPLATGYLSRSGTANVVGLPVDSNLGTLQEIAGAARQLAMLVQPSATAMAGVPFAQQPAVLILDQFGTLRSSANGVDDHPVVTAARLAGSGALQGTTSAAGSDGVVVFTNLSHNVATNITIQFTITGATPTVSDPISISSTTLSRLGFTTQPGNAVAGSAFGTQPVIQTQDQFGNVTTAGLPASLPVMVSLSSGTGPLQGTATLDLGTAAGNGTAAFSDLRIDSAGTNKQLTASAAGLNSGLSAAFTVSSGPAASMVIQTQPPTTVTAGATFSPAVVRVYDAFGNPVTLGSPVVTATRNAGTASLQGTTSVTAVNGVATFATLSYTKAETITINFTSGALTAPTSTSVNVNPAAASKLTIQVQPSATATAGAAFAQQPVIRIEDAYGNLRSSDNSTVVTVARSAGSGTLQGTLSATAVNGVVTFANLSHNLANTISLSFTASGLTGAISSNFAVSPAAFAKLQLLVPGETAAPATASGKTGTPTARTAGTAFNITVNAVDSFWNVINTITDTVDISSSDASATLPAHTALVSGSLTLSVTFKTAGSQTLTASDVTDGTKSANTSPSMTVNAGAFVKMQLLVPGEIAAPGTASGKTGTPATQTSGTAFNVTVNAVDANWNLVSSTNTVGITTTDSNDTHPANAALSAGTRPFAVTFKSVGSWTITAANITDGTKTANTSPSITANAGAFTKLQLLVPGETAAPGSSAGKVGTPTAQLAGTPFTVTVNAVDANWNPITTVTDTVRMTSPDTNASLPADTALVSGTQTLNVTLRTTGTRTLTASDLTDGAKTANTSPSITVNAGPFAKLQVLVPGETAAPGTATGKTGIPTAQAAGTAFNVTLRSVDAAWNLTSSTHTVAITSSDSAAVLPANGALSAGIRTVSVTLKTIGSQTVTGTDITDGTKTANTSPAITVNAGPANKLVIQTQPSSTATAGVAFDQQPVIRVEDAAGNLVTTDNGRVITVARSSGNGTLQGTLTATTVNGVATFANLSHNQANTISLSFTATGLTSATSGNVVVSPAAFAKLQLLVPGETAAPGSATGKTGTPTASTAATAFNITVNAVDSFWNLINTVTDTVDMSSSDANATLPADTALVSGTKTLSVTFKTSGSQILTATDVTDGSKSANTSPSMTVNAGAFVKMQLLVPGETAAPGTATGKTGTPTAQSSGVAFNVIVNAVDANWNVVASSTHTVGITTTDANDTHPANAALSAGTRIFAVTFKGVGSWTITASDITDATKTANTSPAITTTAGAFAKLQILLPGETAAPGTATGKTGTPTAQTASTPFNVTVNAVDANWNALSTVTDTVGITSSDANAVPPANAGLVAGTQTFSVTLKTAGSRTLTASDVTDGTKTANISSSLTVNAGAFVKLQLLVPGETAAPGTATGKTGTPSTLASGTAYNVTIRSVDAQWNLVSSIHTVGITSSDSSATLPANGALAAGTRTASVTLRTLGSQTVTATDITDGTKTANTSPAINVNVGTANKLTIQTQPSSSATAGVEFAQQPIIRVEDATGNLVTNDNGRVITATRSAGTGALQGTVTATTVNGIATFANLSHNDANTITLSFTASGLTSATSGSIVVSPDAATQVLFTTQPAGLRTGSPLATQPVVKAVDQFGNASSVGLPANFNVSLALTSGSGSLSGTTTLDIGSAAGNGTATFTNVELSDAGTNKQITASAAGFTNALSAAFILDGVERATGGTAIPSSTAGGTYTTLTGPVYYEYASGDAGIGTIILNAPAGFVFDTAGTAPTVKIDRLNGSGSNNKNINGVASGTSVAVTSRTTTQITFTVSTASSSGISCSLTWQNIRVRPSAASPLASGNITKTGTSVMAAVNNSSTSFGRLVEFGPPARLVLQTQPSSTATAGFAFAQQPVLRVEDAVGNLLTNNSTTVVTATRNAGSGTLQGTTSRTAVNGLVSFTDLAHNVAGNITITFASGTLTNATSTAIAVSPAAASQLAFATQPANGTYGSTLATQPVLQSRDQFGNDSTLGLAANMDVTVALSAGTGPLLGTTTLNIGTSAGNGVVSFFDLQIDSAGTDKQLTASATGMSSATSSVFTVAKANQTISFGALSARTYGDASFPIGAAASSGLPVSFSIVSGPATISGNAVALTGAGTVTVRASQSGDANWNAATSMEQSFSVAKLTVTGSITASGKVYDGTTAATIATRTLSGVLGADNVSLSGGTATFANKNAGTGKTVTATGLSLSGTAAGNYQLASTSAATTADITPATLIGNITASNKTYDGTTTATIATRTLSGVVGGDAVSLVGGTAAFSDKTVGAGKSVTATGLSLSGADADNYQLASTSAATTAHISVRTLVVSAAGANKVYDGTTTATVTLSDDRVSGDVLTTSSATASFADKNVGAGKTVSVTGISLAGADAVNYTFNTAATSTADITARTLTVTAVGMNKVYDGTTNATVTLMDDRVEGDDLTVSYTAASFADKNVQNGKLVSVSGIEVSGTDVGNYTANTEASTVADITGATLTVVGITAQNKVYDGTTVATLILDGAEAIGVVDGDDVTVVATVVVGAFADAEVGTGKLVTVTGLTLIGADAGKYTLTQPTTTADITAP